MNNLYGMTNVDETCPTVRQLRLLLDAGGRLTNSADHVSELSNGLAYYFVEVTSESGTQIGIPAFGDEAIALHDETLKVTKPVLTVRSR